MKKISEILAEKERTLSFEVFPPKTSTGLQSVQAATEQIAALHPDFMSVTYGAGGGTSRYTVGIASHLQDTYGTPMLSHLTCVSSTREHVWEMITIYRQHGIKNIMALRGDIPAEGRLADDYHHAIELVRQLQENGDFCIGGACHPEGHPESPDLEADVRHLKEKVDAGVDFLTSQLFFDNAVFYDFLDRARGMGIDVPVIAGIMPITDAKQLGRTVSMSGTSIPQAFQTIVDTFAEDPQEMKKAGIQYAVDQIIDLLEHGTKNIHVYSMNKPDVAAAIQKALAGYFNGSVLP